MMNRRRLWITTTVCCVVLALPTISRLTSGLASLELWRRWLATATHRLGPFAAGVTQSATTWVHALARNSIAGGRELVSRWLVPALAGSLRAGWPIALLCGVAVLVAGAVVVLLLGRRADREPAASRRIRRLARQGSTVGGIARRTGLAQDAVRQILRPASAPVPSAFADLLTVPLAPTVRPTERFWRDR